MPWLRKLAPLFAFLGAIGLFFWLTPGTHLVRSQNGYFHLGVARALSEGLPLAAKALRVTSPAAEFVDQHRLFHLALAPLVNLLPDALALSWLNALGFGFMALVFFLSLRNCIGPIGALLASWSLPLISEIALGRFLSGRPTPWAVGLFFLLLLFLQKEGRRPALAAGVTAFFWGGLGYTSLLALPLVLIATSRLAALSTFLGTVGGITVFGGLNSWSHLVNILKTHLDRSVEIVEWQPPQAAGWPLLLTLFTLTLVGWWSRRDRLNAGAVLGVLGSFAIVRLIEFAAPLAAFAFIRTFQTRFQSSLIRTVWVILLVGRIMTLPSLPATDGSIGEDPLGFYAEAARLMSGEKTLTIDWTSWSVAFYVDPSTTVEPGFSPPLYAHRQPERWARYADLFKGRTPSLEEIKVLAEAWGSRFLILPERWLPSATGIQLPFRVVLRDAGLILADLEKNEPPPAPSTIPTGFASAPTDGANPLCQRYHEALTFLFDQSHQLIQGEKRAESTLSRVRRRSALVSLCRRPDLWPASLRKPLRTTCDETYRLIEGALASIHGRPTVWAIEVVLLDLWRRALSPSLPADPAVERLIRSFDQGKRLMTRRTRVGRDDQYGRARMDEIFFSGQYALWLAQHGPPDGRRLSELGRTYFDLYKGPLDHSIFMIRWWAEAMGRRPELDVSDQFLVEFHHGLRFLQKESGCLKEQLPGVAKQTSPSHFSGLVLEGLVHGRRPEATWWKPDFDRLHEDLLHCTLLLQKTDGPMRGMFPADPLNQSFYPDVHAHLMDALAGHISVGACDGDTK